MVPASLHKPTFVCRCFKVGDFLIGKNAIEDLSEYLGQYKFGIGPYRVYDPEYYITNEVKAIRGYVMPPTKQIPIEDIVANIVVIGESKNLLRKYYDMMRVDTTIRKTNPNFKGFILKSHTLAI